VLAHSLGALGIQIQAVRAVLTDQQDIDRAVEILLTAQRMATDGLNETPPSCPYAAFGLQAARRGTEAGDRDLRRAL